jgi:pyrimidine-nucleoside phosphorylase
VLGSNLLQMSGRASSIDEGVALLQSALRSGAGFAKFREFVQNQGGNPSFIDDLSRLPKAPIQHDLVAPNDGFLSAIDAETIGRAAVEIGAGRRVKGEAIDYSVGFVLRAKLGDRVAKGEPLLTIHARDKESALQAEAELHTGLKISDEPVEVPPVVIDVVA